MKKTIIASLAVLASAAVLTTFALAGAGKFGGVQVNADPIQGDYSITFTESNTTVEAVGTDYAICTTTPRGAKVGVVGRDNSNASFTFKGSHFTSLLLFDYDDVLKGRAYEFSAITGFAISFTGGLVAFNGGGTNEKIDSGTPRTGLSITPAGYPMFYAQGSVTVSSLTIMYSC